MYCANGNIKSNKKMKYFLEENFKELICFTLACWIHGNPILVNALEVNPVAYVIASIIGTGLRDEEITISFAKMIHRKISHYHNFPIICWKFTCSYETETYIIYYISWLYNVIKSSNKTLNSTHRAKLKIKSQRQRNTKDENKIISRKCRLL